MADCDQSSDQPSTLADAVHPIQLMFESDGLFYYSAHCCDTANSHWGVITSSSDKLATGCSIMIPVVGSLLRWQSDPPANVRGFISMVNVSEEIVNPNPRNGFRIINEKTTAEKIEGDFVLKNGFADSATQLDPLCQGLLKSMFELYRIDYEYDGDTKPPGAKLQFMFALNPRPISGPYKSLPLTNDGRASDIAFGKTRGFDSEQLIISHRERKGDT